MTLVRNKARIVERRQLSPSVWCLSLDVAPGPLPFRAGQWIHLHVATPSGPVKRAYSIASAPFHTRLELAVTLVEGGAASPLLCELPVGTQVELDGPHGLFTRDEVELRDVPALFVATGTGIAPLRSMLFDAFARPSAPAITLLFGCRTEADILFREQLQTFVAEVPSFRLEVTLSRPSAGWTGRTGYVQQHVAELARALPSPHVFICGLERMVSEVRAVCKGELGYDRKRIHSERYD